jgi:hypothetical protein
MTSSFGWQTSLQQHQCILPENGSLNISRQKKKPDLRPASCINESQKILAAGAAFFALVRAAAARAHIGLFGLRAARAGRLLHVA